MRNKVTTLKGEGKIPANQRGLKAKAEGRTATKIAWKAFR